MKKKTERIRIMSYIKYQRLAANMAATLFTIAIVTSGCEQTDEESEIAAVVSQAITSIEKRDAKNLMKSTTDDFISHPQRWNKGEALKSLYVAMRNSRDMDLLHPNFDIEITDNGNSALFKSPFILVPAGTRFSHLKGLEKDPAAWSEKASEKIAVNRVEISFVKKNGQWLAESTLFN